MIGKFLPKIVNHAEHLWLTLTSLFVRQTSLHEAILSIMISAAGANGIVIGDYLSAQGKSAVMDVEIIKEFNLAEN
ncbi:MAG: hypothetical protein ABFD75_04820 [Smithella sp.]